MAHVKPNSGFLEAESDGRDKGKLLKAKNKRSKTKNNQCRLSNDIANRSNGAHLYVFVYLLVDDKPTNLARVTQCDQHAQATNTLELTN